MAVGWACKRAEGTVSPGSDEDAAVLTLVYVGFNRFTQCRVRATQCTQVKHTVLEETIRIDFWVTDSKRAFAVQYDSTVSRTLIKVFFCVCAFGGWGNWAFIAVRVCVPAVAKLSWTVDQFTGGGTEVILNVAIIVSTQATKLVLIVFDNFDVHMVVSIITNCHTKVHGHCVECPPFEDVHTRSGAYWYVHFGSIHLHNSSFQDGHLHSLNMDMDSTHITDCGNVVAILIVSIDSEVRHVCAVAWL